MKKKITVVADDKIPFLKDSPLAEETELIRLPGKDISRRELSCADALITRTRTKCGEHTLSGTPVRFIATATIGYDHIDTDYCRESGIFWTNAPGCNAESVAQYLISVLLTLAEKNGIDLRTKTLGLIGVGNVGKKVLHAAKAIGMNVLLNDPPRAETEKGFLPLEQILPECDFISLHVPLLRDGKYPTFHLADRDFFNRMKPDSFFINASRGETMNTAEVLNAIQQKKLCGTAIDVWENEPEISRELLNAADIATPHVAGYSTDGKGNGTAAAVHALAKFFDLEQSKTWIPVLPAPENAVFETESLINAVRKSYDVRTDDMRLRENPDLFEKLRGNYPLRREFSAYTTKTADAGLGKVLSELGFRS